MRAVFSKAASAVVEMHAPLHRGCNRINVMLTLNAGYLARDGETAQAVFRRVMKLLDNLYRSVPQTFAGVRRYEVGTDRYGGRHYHIAFHMPRGMRDRLIEALQGWLDEPLDGRRSSLSPGCPKWQAFGTRSGWHLRRIYDLDGALDYMAKVPKGPTGDLESRAVRLRGETGRVREYATFGISKILK